MSNTQAESKLPTACYYRWLWLMAKCPDIPEDTQTSRDVRGWLAQCGDKMELLERDLAAVTARYEWLKDLHPTEITDDEIDQQLRKQIE